MIEASLLQESTQSERGVVRVLTADRRRAWQHLLGSIGEFDFYHTADYHALEAERARGQAEMIVYAERDALMAVPLLFRKIPPAPGAADEGLSDGRSVYGYVGWLASPQVTAAMASRFGRVLCDYLRARQVVSVFARMHPLLVAGNQRPTIGQVEDAGHTIALDLRPGLAHYEKTLAKSHHYEIRKLREQGCRVQRARGGECLVEFVEMYSETMQRLGARSQYFFTEEEFRRLMTSDQYQARLYIARQGGVAAAMAIMIRCGRIVQYHLSCSREGITRYPATKLLLDEAIRDYSTEECHWAHLGGGLGGRQDSLFTFKMGFGGQVLPFRTWKWVLRPEDYGSLAASAPGKTAAFFPVYRYESS